MDCSKAHLKALNHALWTMSRKTLASFVPDKDILDMYHPGRDLHLAEPLDLEDLPLIRFVLWAAFLDKQFYLGPGLDR